MENTRLNETDHNILLQLVLGCEIKSKYPTYGAHGEAPPNKGFEGEDVDQLIPTKASMGLQLSLDQYIKENEQVMCLHARELRITHPYSGEEMVFQDPPDF